jgi:recombination protein RecT
VSEHTQAVQAQAPPQRSIKALLTTDDFKQQLGMALPRHIRPDRMLRTILTSVRKTPKLLQCTPESFFSSVLTLAQLGLEPDDPRGQAHLVPFNKKDRNTGQWVPECQVIIGYRGYIDLARRTGEVATIRAEVVYERDEFSYETGLTTKLVHKPTEAMDPGKVRAAYAVATMRDGTQVEKVLWARDIERARMSSKEGAQGRGPWHDWYPEMAAKTAVRRLMKTLPSSAEFSLAESIDDAPVLPIDMKTLEIDTSAAVARLPEQTEAEEQTTPVADRMAAKAAKAAPATPAANVELDENGNPLPSAKF